MKYLTRVVYSAFIVFFCCFYLPGIVERTLWVTLLSIAFYLFIQIMPSFHNRKRPTTRLRICGNGCELLIIFLLSGTVSVCELIYSAFVLIPDSYTVWLWKLLFVVLIESFVFWNGIIRVYCMSKQIGFKWRLIGLLCGFVPFANLYALYKIIKIASFETNFESMCIIRNQSRKEQRICDTKYPLLLVHGVFFRDFKHFNYWGRIPAYLEENGARIYYGNHQSAASVADSGAELSARIKQIVAETKCEKVNVIAHSKGGLDTRYAISKLDAAPYIASLTTINTPHRGCEFADFLLNKISADVKNNVAKTYNAASKKLGDENPDFLSAVNNLTASFCAQFNEEVFDNPEVYYQSVGSKLNCATGGRFPLNFSTMLVKHFDGPNDGLVAENSFPWGSKYQFLTVKGRRGISHGDMIDLNREDIEEFDVREFYVGIVDDLRQKGF